MTVHPVSKQGCSAAASSPSTRASTPASHEPRQGSFTHPVEANPVREPAKYNSAPCSSNTMLQFHLQLRILQCEPRVSPEVSPESHILCQPDRHAPVLPWMWRSVSEWLFPGLALACISLNPSPLVKTCTPMQGDDPRCEHMYLPHPGGDLAPQEPSPLPLDAPFTSGCPPLFSPLAGFSFHGMQQAVTKPAAAFSLDQEPHLEPPSITFLSAPGPHSGGPYDPHDAHSPATHGLLTPVARLPPSPMVRPPRSPAYAPGDPPLVTNISTGHAPHVSSSRFAGGVTPLQAHVSYLDPYSPSNASHLPEPSPYPSAYSCGTTAPEAKSSVNQTPARVSCPAQLGRLPSGSPSYHRPAVPAEPSSAGVWAPSHRPPPEPSEALSALSPVNRPFAPHRFPMDPPSPLSTPGEKSSNDGVESLTSASGLQAHEAPYPAGTKHSPSGQYDPAAFDQNWLFPHHGTALPHSHAYAVSQSWAAAGRPMPHPPSHQYHHDLEQMYGYLPGLPGPSPHAQHQKNFDMLNYAHHPRHPTPAIPSGPCCPASPLYQQIQDHGHLHILPPPVPPPQLAAVAYYATPAIPQDVAALSPVHQQWLSPSHAHSASAFLPSLPPPPAPVIAGTPPSVLSGQSNSSPRHPQHPATITGGGHAQLSDPEPVPNLSTRMQSVGPDLVSGGRIVSTSTSELNTNKGCIPAVDLIDQLSASTSTGPTQSHSGGLHTSLPQHTAPALYSPQIGTPPVTSPVDTCRSPNAATSGTPADIGNSPAAVALALQSSVVAPWHQGDSLDTSGTSTSMLEDIGKSPRAKQEMHPTSLGTSATPFLPAITACSPATHSIQSARHCQPTLLECTSANCASSETGIPSESLLALPALSRDPSPPGCQSQAQSLDDGLQVLQLSPLSIVLGS
eukprot:gene3268-623_t